MTPSAGPNAVVKIGGTTLPAINWKIDIDPKAKDYSNFQVGRARLKTLQDATLTMEIVWDTTNEPNASGGFNLTDGTVVTVDCYTDSTHYFVVPGIVNKVSPGVASLEDVVMYPVEIALSYNGSISTVTYPVSP